MNQLEEGKELTLDFKKLRKVAGIDFAWVGLARTQPAESPARTIEQILLKSFLAHRD